jgi:hypothetical protein
MHQKVLFLELNEFNQDLLIKSAHDLSLKNLEKLVSLHKMSTLTEDTYESDFLEPWVQWVTVHTGIPSTHHQIKHLGDVPHLGTEQIWEALSKKGMSSGIWGAMNASRGAAENCLFFVPDPWTVSEKGYPDPWDGKYKGNEVPPGAYFYIIDLGGGLKPKSGSLTLVR